MPAAPKAGKVGGVKGGFKVFGQVQPQQKPHGAGDLRIAGKVEIQLECIKNRRQNQHRRTVVLVAPEHLAHKNAQHIADGNHLEKPQRQQPQAAHGARRVKAMLLLELGQKLPGAADGTLRHRGKKRGVQGKIDKIGFRLAVAAGGVDQVADGGKGVKADAQRHRKTLPAAGADEGAVVFKKCQNRQQAHNAHAQHGGFVRPAAQVQRPPAQVGKPADGNAQRQHGGHIHSFARCSVKKPAGSQQKRALQPLGQQQVDGDRYQ